MKVLLFIGAGASVELGVPAMRRMAEQFRDHLHDLELPDEIIGKIDALVGDHSKDMEHAIDVIDRLEGGYRAKIELGGEPNEDEILPYRVIRDEAEWFVQHCCEQIKTEAAIGLWSPTLRAAENLELTIASTNYDRAIEVSAARQRIKFEDGFEDFSGREFAQWRGFQDDGSNVLLKLHGSTDWYRASNDDVYKLRHPMPIFGKLKVLPEDLLEHPLESALVLPSREKVISLSPFPNLASEFRQRAKLADVAIFLGSSLRDPHMRDVCVACASTKATFIVSRSGEFDANILPDNAIVIKQSAGRFLISTFPKFLLDQSDQILREAAVLDSTDTSDVLGNLVLAYDENADADSRCAAIEGLADEGVPLLEEEVKKLLLTECEEVAAFALGLVPGSFSKVELIGIAKGIAEERKQAQFNAELGTLMQLLASE